MKTICKDRRRQLDTSTSRNISAVAADIDKLLGLKTYEQLETLERQVKQKLNSNEAIDVDYWEDLLRNISVRKAKAKLRKVSQAIVSERLEAFRKKQEAEAAKVRKEMEAAMKDPQASDQGTEPKIPYDASLDPEPLLKLRPEDKNLESMEDKDFLKQLVCCHD